MSGISLPGNTGRPQSAATTGQRRYLTLLFADLSGSTRLGTALEAEHYFAVLAELGRLARAVIERHGGTVVRMQGDGVLAIFGHPETSEADGRHAVEATLELHEAVRALRVEPADGPPLTLTMHSGIHAGLVLVSEGDVERGRLELTGSVPNIAARLSDAARADEILVSEESLGPDAELFLVAERKLVEVSEAAAPVVTLRIAGRAEAARRATARGRRRFVSFVGRQAELRRLEAALAEVRAGRPRRVAISAAAGMGKTRFASVFLGRCLVAGCHVLQGSCERELGAKPLQPVVQMLRSALRVESAMNDEQARARVAASAARLSSALEPHVHTLLQALSLESAAASAAPAPPLAQMRAAFAAMVSALAAEAPVVLFVDDWHWIDDASFQLLVGEVTARPDRVMTLFASRPFAAGESWLHAGFETLELRPLSPEESAAAVRALLPAADPFLIDAIGGYAGGNPLFIEELCHRASREPQGPRLGPLHGGAAWLSALIESRVARLPSAEAALVRTAAVVGDVIPDWLFESVTGCGADDERVTALAREDLIFRGEQARTLRFKHAITRDVVYHSVGLHDRRALHLKVARALLEHAHAESKVEEESDALAYHFGAGGEAAEAAKYAEIAGNRAVAASALDRAQAHFRAALAALDRLPPSLQRSERWITVAQRLGLACVFDSFRADLPLFERALALALETGDATAIARAYYWLGYIHYALGDQRESIRLSAMALEASRRAGDDRLTFQVEATLGQAYTAASRYALASPLLDEAIAVKRRHRSGAGVAVGLAYSLATKGQVLGDRGDFAGAEACFAEAIDLVRGIHEVGASIKGLHAAVLLWQGRWAEAQQAATESYRIGERVRSLFSTTMGRAAAAYGRWMERGEDEALEELMSTAAWLLPRGNALFRSYILGWCTDALVAAGRQDEARRHAALCLQRARELDLLGGAMACRAMARQAGGRGRASAARKWLRRAQAIADARESRHERAANLLCEGEVALALGAREIARERLAAAEQAARELAMPWHANTAAALRARA